MDTDGVVESRECDVCLGTGIAACHFCEGAGAAFDSTKGVFSNCFGCGGSGARSCVKCDGKGEVDTD
jgi:hypothetical protein